MAVGADKVRKMVTLPREIAEQIEDFRFANRHRTESDAMVELLKLGLKTAKPGKK
jgi:hypothetical protein